VRDPDQLGLLSSLRNIAPGEELHGTYFVGEKAYIVTYRPPPPDWDEGGGRCGWFGCSGDPLWIVSMEEPTAPEVLGELELPGWSDFVFPIGNRLVGVGRGELGNGVGAALFDISNPRQPELLTRLEFGSPSSTSEANVDFRGVEIVEPGELSDAGILAVPFDDVFVTESGCEDRRSYLQLVDIRSEELLLKANVELRGVGRRALPVGDRLYAIDDQDVSVIDVSDTDRPVVTSTIRVGDGNVVVERCLAFGGLGEMSCNVSGAGLEGSSSSAAASVVGFLLLALALRRWAR
jgi:hypothetical protein